MPIFLLKANGKSSSHVLNRISINPSVSEFCTLLSDETCQNDKTQKPSDGMEKFFVWVQPMKNSAKNEIQLMQEQKTPISSNRGWEDNYSEFLKV